jgi:hypothetical protein
MRSFASEWADQLFSLLTGYPVGFSADSFSENSTDFGVPVGTHEEGISSAGSPSSTRAIERSNVIAFVNRRNKERAR